MRSTEVASALELPVKSKPFHNCSCRRAPVLTISLRGRASSLCTVYSVTGQTRGLGFQDRSFQLPSSTAAVGIGAWVGTLCQTFLLLSPVLSLCAHSSLLAIWWAEVFRILPVSPSPYTSFLSPSFPLYLNLPTDGFQTSEAADVLSVEATELQSLFEIF